MTEIKAVPQSAEAEILLRKAEVCTHPVIDEGFCIECGKYFPTDAEIIEGEL